MRRKNLAVPFMLFGSGVILLLFLIMQPVTVFHFREHIALLFPKGIIALEERNLLFILQALMLLVILPVYVLTFVFSWKYRAGRAKAVYDPDLVDSSLAEVIWWGLPFLMTLLVAILTWVKTYELDPYRPLESDKKPITVQVVALQWNWLFLYPEENIASLNFLQIPEKTPIHFLVTADAPMNSFWIPHLSGQIYAMPAMQTQLNLIADRTGDFRGSSANLSGEGFSGMHFIARASSEEDYRKWIDGAKASTTTLTTDVYHTLAAPSPRHKPELFRLGDRSLFRQIIMKYMQPQKVQGSDVR